MRLRSGRLFEEKREHTFEEFESKVSDSNKLVSCEDIKVKMATLCELTASNLATQP